LVLREGKKSQSGWSIRKKITERWNTRANTREMERCTGRGRRLT